MNLKLLGTLILLGALVPYSASAQAPPSHAREVAGMVESWGDKAKPRSATLSVWQEQIRGEEYAVFQLRADLDLYQFALTQDQLRRLIDALKNYQLVARQATPSSDEAVGWLYRTEIRLRRLGQEAKEDRLLVNVERKERQKPTLSFTFDSWLLSFGGPDSPADRAHKGVTIQQPNALSLQGLLESVLRSFAR